MNSPITSPFAPDLAAVRAWLEKTIAAAKFVDLIAAILALFKKMAELNAELTRRLAHSRRRHPFQRSPRLTRLCLPRLTRPVIGIREADTSPITRTGYDGAPRGS